MRIALGIEGGIAQKKTTTPDATDSAIASAPLTALVRPMVAITIVSRLLQPIQ